MKFEFEILDTDLEDRNKIIEMKVEVLRRINQLSEFGQNTMSDSLVRLKNDLEFAENEWLFCQRDRVVNKLSEALNVGRERLGERYWDD
jgi:hypothetical protein